MSDNARWVRPLGSASDRGWEVAIDSAVDGWQHTSLYAGRLAEGESREIPSGEWEHVVVPLSASVRTVESGDGKATLAGRASVFAGPTDVAYVARDSSITVTATGGPARVAVCGARAAARKKPTFRHPRRAGGAGRAARCRHRQHHGPQLRDPGGAGRRLDHWCEVITPAGNWSSYPPHKHDEARDGVETELEEEISSRCRSRTERRRPRAQTVGYQRVYGTDGGQIDVLAEVRSGDVVLVPHGWHGPATAPPATTSTTST